MKVKLAARVFSQRVAATLRLLVNYSKKTVHYKTLTLTFFENKITFLLTF